MKYKIRKYKNFKRRYIFETYEPKKRINLSKEHSFSLFFQIGNFFLFLGGFISFFVSSLFLLVKSFLGLGERVKRISFNRKMIEFKIKK